MNNFVAPIYQVCTKDTIHFTNPLHVTNFYKDTQRWHHQKMQDRQNMILYMANLHSRISDSKKPRAFCTVKIPLTALRNWVYDYRTVFDHFFEVTKLGYKFESEYELTTVIPRKLEKITNEVKMAYKLPPLPNEGVVSKVYVQKHNRQAILKRLKFENRMDLHAPVIWLLEQESSEINFYFVPAGKLKLRDTSIWPIPAIETWPGWLREALFGSGIDIDSAYTQFLVSKLSEIYKDRPDFIQVGFPDLFRILQDKIEWRRELCCDILGLPFTDENIAIVKKLCMSLANGSRISPAILTSNSGYSVTKDIIITEASDCSLENLTKIGERLSAISKQFSSARKIVCTAENNLHPSRLNQKLVFKNYFEWERIARYKIWEQIDRHGIMVHDGIDGVPLRYLNSISDIVNQLNIKLST